MNPSPRDESATSACAGAVLATSSVRMGAPGLTRNLGRGGQPSGLARKRHILGAMCLLPLVVLAGCGEIAEVEGEVTWTCPSDVADELGFASRVVAFHPGNGAGFGAEEAVVGAPMGLGEVNGGLDVLTLGDGGSVVVELAADAVDCEGPDLIVFENPFAVGDFVYTELGQVSVSLDGEHWHAFPCDADGAYPHEGCGGVGYVYAGAEPTLDARDPTVAGGDAFDLADVGVDRVRYVRVVDLERTNGLRAPPSRGFDLDAVGIARGHALARP